MKVLITGGLGFLGFNLTVFLLKNNIEVHVIDNSNLEKLNLVPSEYAKIFKFINYNLLKQNLENLVSNDYTHIVHLAALLGVQNVIENSYSILKYNYQLTEAALQIAYVQPKLEQFIFASTSEVYAGTLEIDDLKIPTPENSNIILPSLVKPRTTYMLSKIYGEASVIQSGLPYVIIRPHNIYGPNMGLKHVIPQLLEKAYFSRNGYLDVYSCDHTRTFCFIEDAVNMIFLLMNNKKVLNNTFNIGNEKPEIKIRTLANKIIKVVGKKLILNEMSITEGSPSRRAPSMKKFYKFVKYEKTIPIELGIYKSFEWYKNFIFNKENMQ